MKELDVGQAFELMPGLLICDIEGKRSMVIVPVLAESDAWKVFDLIKGEKGKDVQPRNNRPIPV